MWGEGRARAPTFDPHTIKRMQVPLSPYSPISVLLRQPLSIKKSYAGAIHSPVEGGWISNSRPLLVLLSHVHVHRGGAAPDVLLAPDDGGRVDPVVVPPS